MNMQYSPGTTEGVFELKQPFLEVIVMKFKLNHSEQWCIKCFYKSVTKIIIIKEKKNSGIVFLRGHEGNVEDEGLRPQHRTESEPGSSAFEYLVLLPKHFTSELPQ